MPQEHSEQNLTGVVSVRTAAIITLIIAFFSAGLLIYTSLAPTDTLKFRLFSVLGWVIVTISMGKAFKDISDMA